MISKRTKRRYRRRKKCTNLLHGGVLVRHRTSTRHKSGTKMRKKKEHVLTHKRMYVPSSQCVVRQAQVLNNGVLSVGCGGGANGGMGGKGNSV